MTTRLAINGLGRIGRALVRVLDQRTDLDLDLVAVNDRAPIGQIGPLVLRDSVYGPFAGPVEVADDHRPGDRVVLGGSRPTAFQTADAGSIPWRDVGAEIVVEATGSADRRAQLTAHLEGGAERVIVSANLADADLTVCLGVNDDRLRPSHRIVSNASCTTNCMAPVAKTLHDAFGLERGLLTTVHAYTRGQELLDGPHEDPRRARAAGLNIVPAGTGAARAVGLVLPELAGRLDGQAVRVPTPAVSMVQFVVDLAARPSIDAVEDALVAAAAGPLAGLLATTDEPLVSSDFVRHPASAVVDLGLLQQVDGGLVRVVAWYDNEWGYANRLAELAALMGGNR